MNISEVKIKMCGMFREQDIDAVNDTCPDYCGFIVDYPKSHRSIDKETLRKLSSRLRKEIISVGVFVDAPEELVKELLLDGVTDMAQLHGDESHDMIKRIKADTGRQVIKAFRIPVMSSEADRDQYAAVLKRAMECPADHVLLDPGRGDGKSADFRVLKSMMDSTGFDRPFFLAGGIDADNIEEAVRILHPYAIDLSSGIETDRLKDPEKMRRIVLKSRGVVA